jgi:hypothetical protein
VGLPAVCSVQLWVVEMICVAGCPSNFCLAVLARLPALCGSPCWGASCDLVCSTRSWFLECGVEQLLGAAEWLAQCVTLLIDSTATARIMGLDQQQQGTDMVGHRPVAYVQSIADNSTQV